MHSFESDYTAGARVEILRRLNETNLEQLPGYGSDKYCESAKEKIRAACDCPGADIFFMVGGTQTNAVVIDSMLPSYGGVIAAQTGHISDHEAGAIEFTGHKVIALPVYDGKLRAEDVWMYMKDYWQDASHQHFVYPGMDQNKNTFVRLHGVEACRARITEETQRAVAALAPFGQAEFLTELAQRLTSRDH
jgi:threonine aldolase